MNPNFIKPICLCLSLLLGGTGCEYFTRNPKAKVAAGISKKRSLKTLVGQLPVSSRLVGSGSGFLVTDDGFLLTNHHVVKAGNRFLIQTENGSYHAKLVKSSPEDDLALLKVKGSFTALRLADSQKAKLGEEVFTVGFPNISMQGLSPKLTKGSISSTTGMRDDPRFLQISVPIQPGNSGGALCNERGQVVGVISSALVSTSSVVQFQNVNYAIKSSVAREFLSKTPADQKIATASENSLKAIARAQNATALILVYQAPENSLAAERNSTTALDTLENWLTLLDSGDLENAWRLTSAEFRAGISKKMFMQSMENLGTNYGRCISRQLLRRSAGDQRLAVQFAASCELAPRAIETTTLSRDPSGNWLVSGYRIQ